MTLVAHESAGLSPAAKEQARALSRWALVAGVALGSTGHIAASTVASIAAQDLLGSTTFAGAPGAAVVLGAAAGALLLSQTMARRGRRPWVAAGYPIGVRGARLPTPPVVTRSVSLLMLRTLFI